MELALVIRGYFVKVSMCCAGEIRVFAEMKLCGIKFVFRLLARLSNIHRISAFTDAHVLCVHRHR
jgi:hypothetical protein